MCMVLPDVGKTLYISTDPEEGSDAREGRTLCHCQASELYRLGHSCCCLCFAACDRWLLDSRIWRAAFTSWSVAFHRFYRLPSGRYCNSACEDSRRRTRAKEAIQEGVGGLGGRGSVLIDSWNHLGVKVVLSDG